MTQALMPGDEPISIEFKPAPELNASDPVSRLSSAGGALRGCACDSCRQMRAAAQPATQRSDLVGQYGGAGYQTPAYPELLPPGWVAGRYDFSQSQGPTRWLQGQVRWREPGTMNVWDSSGNRQWTYTDELPDGTLVDNSGRMWVPDRVAPADSLYYEAQMLAQ